MTRVKIMSLRCWVGFALLALVISVASCNKSREARRDRSCAEDICVSG